jgi:hypothetical protein
MHPFARVAAGAEDSPDGDVPEDVVFGAGSMLP